MLCSISPLTPEKRKKGIKSKEENPQHPTSARVELEIWEPEQVKEALKEAAQVIRRIPLTNRDIPVGYRSAWPEVVRSYWECYASESAPRIMRFRDPPARIARAELMMQKIFAIKDARARKVIAAWAFGVKWREIQAFDGRSKQYLMRYILDPAVARIARSLSAAQSDT